MCQFGASNQTSPSKVPGSKRNLLNFFREANFVVKLGTGGSDFFGLEFFATHLGARNVKKIQPPVHSVVFRVTVSYENSSSALNGA